MGLKIQFDVRELEADLRQRGDRTMANGARSLRRISERMRNLAIEYAPRDDGDIEKAIKINDEIRDSRRRLTFQVYVDPNAETTPKERADGSIPLDPKTVSEYALLMEQGLAPYGSGRYDLDKSEEKAKQGYDVGGKFMTRAYREAIKRARSDVGDELRAAFVNGRGARINAPNARFRRLRESDNPGDDE